MSVLIKGMEMPKNCDVCFVKPACCPAIRKRLESKYQPYTWIPANYRHEDCPLIAFPPHGRLIDADALDVIGYCGIPQGREDTFDDGVMWLAEQIDLLPTIIEAEGYSERELQRDYEASVEYAQHCGRYEPTYDPETGAM